MRVVPLGTSSALPAHSRHLSAIAVALNGRWLLLDCGEGTQYRVTAAGMRTHQLEAIFITHLHGDHVFGLPGLLATMTMQNRKAPLAIYGPAGIERLVQTFLDATSMISGFPLEFRELRESAPRHLREAAGYSVEVLPLDHRVAAFGYRITESAPLPRVDLERAAKLGLSPGPSFRLLKMGQSVVSAAGRRVRSCEVLLPRAIGRTIAYCTDTRPCENAAILGRHADLLIHEATYSSDLAALAHERGHSTARDAAEIASRAHARSLLITHFSSRYADPEILVREARELFPATHAARELLPVAIEPAPETIPQRTTRAA
jgi:ribonuclease Z